MYCMKFDADEIIMLSGEDRFHFVERILVIWSILVYCSAAHVCDQWVLFIAQGLYAKNGFL